MSIITSTEQLSRALQAKLGEYKGLPCEVGYQDLAEESTVALAITALAGAPKAESDICGGYDCEQGYAVYLRLAPETDDERIDAEGFLNDLLRWLEDDRNYPKLSTVKVWDIEQTSTPSLISRENDGVRIYQALFAARYEITNLEDTKNDKKKRTRNLR